MSDCTIGKELKQSTCRYVKECKRGYTRNDKFICRKTTRRVKNPNGNAKTKPDDFESGAESKSPELIFPIMNPTPDQSKSSDYGLVNTPPNKLKSNSRKKGRSAWFKNPKVQFNVEPDKMRITPPKKKKPGKLPRLTATLGSKTLKNSYELGLPVAENIRKSRRATIKSLKPLRTKSEENVRKNFLSEFKEDLPRKRIPYSKKNSKKTNKLQPKPKRRQLEKTIEQNKWIGPGFRYDSASNTIGEPNPFSKVKDNARAKTKERAKSKAKTMDKSKAKPRAKPKTIEQKDWIGPGFRYDSGSNTIGKPNPFSKVKENND